MTFNQAQALDSLIAGGLQQSQMSGQLLAQLETQLFPSSINPFAGGAGNFWANEIAYMNSFSNYAWQESWKLALMTPDGQLPPGFGGIHLSNAVTGGQEMFGDYLGQLQNNGIVMDMIHDTQVQTILGQGNFYDPYTQTIFSGVPLGYEHYYTDPFGNVSGFQDPIPNPMIIGVSEIFST